MKIYTHNNVDLLDLQIQKLKSLVEPIQKRRASVRRKDVHGRDLGGSEYYLLRTKSPRPVEFFGGKSLASPLLVKNTNEAMLVTGKQLENSNYDWTQTWDAVPENTPSANIVLGR